MRFPVFLLRRREDAPEAPWLRAAVGVYLEHLVQRPYHGFPVRLPVHPETLVIEDGQRQPHEVFHRARVDDLLPFNQILLRLVVFKQLMRPLRVFFQVHPCLLGIFQTIQQLSHAYFRFPETDFFSYMINC